MKLEIDIPSILYQDAKENRNYISLTKLEIAWKAIADGKPLEQEPKTGHWMNRGKQGEVLPFYMRYECSICGETADKSNYCPNCGAKMAESEE